MFEFCSTSAMASGVRLLPPVSSAPKRAKGSVHHQLQLSFPSEELRDSFHTRLEHAKKLFFSRKSVDNAQFMNALLAKLDRL